MNQDTKDNIKQNIKHPIKYIQLALETSSSEGRVLIGILSFFLYVGICVLSVAISYNQKISYYESYMDSQEEELRALTSELSLVKQTNAEILEDMQIVRELSQVGK